MLRYLVSTKVIWVMLLASITCVSCSDDPGMEEATSMEVDDTNARFVIEGTPWIFDRYELLEVRERNGSSLSEEELEGLISEDFTDVVIEFNDNGTGTEVGFDPIPSAFFWELNSAGSVVFLDQVGNEFSPLGFFDTDIAAQEISFTFEFPFQDISTNTEIVVYGTTYLKSASW